MASFFRTHVEKDIGTTPVDVVSMGANNRATLIGCNLANTTDDNVYVDIIVENASAVAGYYIKQLMIDPYTSAKVITNGEKLIIAENCKLRIISDTADSVDAILSYAEIV
jgi:hypothetical protein